MEFDHYQVVPGDTLSKIAQQHGVDVDELARINQIREPNYIRAGQSLKIPRKAAAQNDEDFYSELWIRFVDALGNPIANLKARIATADGEYQCTTDDIGLLPPVRTTHKDDKPQVFVEKLSGGEKKITEISAPPGTHQFTLRSPKLKLETTLRPHEGIPDHSPGHPLKLEPGQVQHNRDLRGNPVINIGMECPNKDNLRLGPNHKYREYILAASLRSGFKPQAIAAVINVEAGKIKLSVDKQIKVKGKICTVTARVSTGEWAPNSAADRSSAVGLTQFLSGTWLGEALRDGSFLNQKAISKGWVSKDAHGNFHVVPEHKVELLDFRKNPEAAIMAAVDYGVINLALLSERGYNFEKLNDGERAKMLYLSHQLGPADASRYLAGTIVADDIYTKPGPGRRAKLISRGAKKLLSTQITPEAATKLAKKNGGDYVKAHRIWLSDFIDKGINFKNFACDQTQLPDPRNLLELVMVVGGKNPQF